MFTLFEHAIKCLSAIAAIVAEARPYHRELHVALSAASDRSFIGIVLFIYCEFEVDWIMSVFCLARHSWHRASARWRPSWRFLVQCRERTDAPGGGLSASSDTQPSASAQAAS